MATKYFEDFETGATYETKARTVTEADVVSFCGLSGDFNPLHTDAETAKQTPFGERIAHGLLVLSISSGLVNQTGMFAGSTLAFLGLEDWKFQGPVRFGDTIHVRMTVEEARPSSKGGRGIIRWRREVVNQHGEVVQSGLAAVMMAMRKDDDAE
jgi:acyl dehydratase